MDDSAKSRIAWVATLAALTAAAVLAHWLYGNPIPDWLADKDFANYWIAARLVLEGRVLDLFADHATYFSHMTAQFGADYPWHNWSYPPHYLLFVWPAGLLSYPAAMVAFLAVTLAFYIVAARAFAGVPPLAMAGVMLAPFLLANLWAAQNGFLTGGLLLGGLALRYRRPVLAGILFGCLTIKPQLGLLLPFLLLIERRWAVIAAASVTTGALVVLSAALFGWQSWIGYLTVTMPYQSQVMNAGAGLFLSMMPSVFGALRVLGIDASPALVVHLIVAVPVIILAALAVLRSADADERAAILILATMAATPYWLVYDYGAAAAALLLIRSRLSRADGAGGRMSVAALSLAALVPLVAVPSGLAGLPVAPLLVLAGFAVIALPAAARERGA